MIEQNLRISADYFQFLVQDEKADGDVSDLWTKETVKDMLVVRGNIIGIRTARNTIVPVVVEIVEEVPNDQDFEKWDQLVECNIDIISGKLVIMGVTDYFPDAARIKVIPGKYRVKICYGNLNSIENNGIDGNDIYKIILWFSSAPEGIIFTKKYNEPK